MPRHSKRVRDALLRNGRPTRQQTLLQKDEETVTTIHYTNREQYNSHAHTCTRLVFADNPKVDTIIHRDDKEVFATVKREEARS
jgi:hypothetical protein